MATSQISSLYHLSTSAYLSLQAIPLLLSPNLIVSLLASGQPRPTTDLETYFARTLALALLTLAGLSLLLTSALPIPGVPQNNNTDDEGDDAPKNPYAQPTVAATTAYHALSAFYLYMQVTYGWTLGFGAGMVASTGLFCLGTWTLLFGGDKGRTSKRTGADKRTGNFPFVNEASAREKKKESKRKSVASKSR